MRGEYIYVKPERISKMSLVAHMSIKETVLQVTKVALGAMLVNSLRSISLKLDTIIQSLKSKPDYRTHFSDWIERQRKIDSSVKKVEIEK